ncbi:hypothetical protein ACL02T_06270 [Pseudonocardia sp. RS010]|uniref:hypothetical protein n=1 Tax=Pseudonocardia sp. RS010 TaxID=3385979 RepID=UPI0039A2EB3A
MPPAEWTTSRVIRVTTCPDSYRLELVAPHSEQWALIVAIPCPPSGSLDHIADLRPDIPLAVHLHAEGDEVVSACCYLTSRSGPRRHVITVSLALRLLAAGIHGTVRHQRSRPTTTQPDHTEPIGHPADQIH